MGGVISKEHRSVAGATAAQGVGGEKTYAGCADGSDG